MQIARRAADWVALPRLIAIRGRFEPGSTLSAISHPSRALRLTRRRADWQVS